RARQPVAGASSDSDDGRSTVPDVSAPVRMGSGRTARETGDGGSGASLHTSGSASVTDSSATPRTPLLPANSAARPCAHAAADAASSANFGFCASRVPTIPESTSPLPAVASSGVPVAVTTHRPSGAAITEGTPLSSTTAPVVAARLLAPSYGSASTSSTDPPASLANSAG